MKKMTSNDLKKIESATRVENYKISFELDGEIIDIEVKPYISLQEQSDIIDSSVKAAFTNDGLALEYKEAVFKFKIIDIATNIPTLKKKDNIDLVRYCEIYDRLGLEDKIQDLSDYWNDMITDLRTAVYHKLEYQKQLIIHANRNDELVDAVLNFLDKTTATIGEINTLVGGLSADSINEMVTKVAKDGGINLSSLKGLLDVGVKDVTNVGSDNAENKPELEVVK